MKKKEFAQPNKQNRSGRPAIVKKKKVIICQHYWLTSLKIYVFEYQHIFILWKIGIEGILEKWKKWLPIKIQQ
jgi:hypothetical protein